MTDVIGPEFAATLELKEGFPLPDPAAWNNWSDSEGQAHHKAKYQPDDAPCKGVTTSHRPLNDEDDAIFLSQLLTKFEDTTAKIFLGTAARDRYTTFSNTEVGAIVMVARTLKADSTDTTPSWNLFSSFSAPHRRSRTASSFQQADSGAAVNPAC